MGYILEFNCLLTVPNDQLDLKTLQMGQHYQLVKDDERLYPLNIAIEICDKDTYTFYGKVMVRKLTLEKGKTTLEFDVVKIFTAEESATFTQAFIKPQ